MHFRFIVFALVLLAAGLAQAHQSSDSYLTLRQVGPVVEGQWDIALRDLENALALDADGDSRIVWGELRRRAGEIGEFALAQLELRADGTPCSKRAGNPRVDRHGGGSYVVLDLVFECGRSPREVEVEYALFADLDPTHRGLLQFETAQGSQTSVLGGDRTQERFSVIGGSALRAFSVYLVEGAWHIWIGIDHILFLLCLLLPAVLPSETRSEGRAELREVTMRVVRVVTAFTAAHSITLVLGTLGWVELPSRWVESGIAASVVLVAINNLFPILRAESWRLAFAFGLLHGLGFASVLADLGLEASTLIPALLGFNVGVELGQAAIVAAFLPIAFALRDTAVYRRGLFPVGSAAMGIIAALWLAERSFELELVAFL